MRKFTFSLSLSLISLAIPWVAQAGVPEAVTYLKTQTQDDWVTLALVAAGETSVTKSHLTSFSGTLPTDYAKRILAIVAVGEDPKTFAGVDLVAGLKGLAQAGQIGEPTLLNDDAWGILALRAAGVPSADAVVAGAKQHLLTNQEADGGWGFGIGFGSDTNDTAAVLMALAEVGLTSSDTVVQDAVSYLQTQQVASGGFAYQLPCFWPDCDQADSASTSWVIDALNKLGLDASSWVQGANTPQSFLLSLQTGDGSFKWQVGDPAGSAGMTAFAVVPLENDWYPVKQPLVKGSGGGPTPLSDLELTLELTGGEQHEGSSAMYHVKLANLGPNIGTGTAVTFTLPPGAALTPGEMGQGSYDAARSLWDLGWLNNYAQAEFNFSLAFPLGTAGAVQLTAQATANERDIVSANNIAQLDFTVVPAPVVLGEQTSEEIIEPAPAPIATCVTSEGLASSTPPSFLGRSLLDLEQGSALWYVDPVTAQRYCLPDAATAYHALEVFGLGITNTDLAKIPVAQGELDSVEVLETPIDEALVQRLSGRILLQVESVGEAWYVNPVDGKRYYLKDGAQTLERLTSWGMGMTSLDLGQIAAGNLAP